MTDLPPQAQAILDAFNGYHEMVNRRVKIAAALRVLADELSYTIFLPGNDCRVIDARAVYKIIEELELL